MLRCLRIPKLTMSQSFSISWITPLLLYAINERLATCKTQFINWLSHDSLSNCLWPFRISGTTSWCGILVLYSSAFTGNSHTILFLPYAPLGVLASLLGDCRAVSAQSGPILAHIGAIVVLSVTLVHSRSGGNSRNSMVGSNLHATHREVTDRPTLRWVFRQW